MAFHPEFLTTLYTCECIETDYTFFIDRIQGAADDKTLEIIARVNDVVSGKEYLYHYFSQFEAGNDSQVASASAPPIEVSEDEGKAALSWLKRLYRRGENHPRYKAQSADSREYIAEVPDKPFEPSDDDLEIM